jgi:glyoxylase-like metal-dependent hydrolase (beta-lactamase superfamily II)
MTKEIVKGIYVETQYEGVNVGAIQVADDLICIDSPSYPRDARKWSTILGSIHSRPARFLFLTDCHGDRLLNTRWLNAPLVIHQEAAEQIRALKRRYPQEWLSSLSRRNPTAGKELSSSPIETVTMSFSKEMTIVVDDMSIVLRNEPGPSPSSSWLYIPERKILFAGDSIAVDTHPLISEMNCKQWIESLRALTEHDDLVDIIVPGRGPISDMGSVGPVLDYLLHIQNLVREHIEAGKMRESLADYFEELVNCFPVDPLPVEWIKDQIFSGLNRVYQEILVEEYFDSSILEQT